MPLPAFADEQRRPAVADVRAAAGPAADPWDRLAGWLDRTGAKGSFLWYGRRSGWTLRYLRSGRPFVTATPEEGSFTVQIVLGRAEVEPAAALPLGERTRRICEGARQYPDGRWLFIPVETATDLADVLALLELKLPPRVRARLAR